ncbi:MAG: hypothetical protein AB4426_25055 [Xenococcaceae cyanobacterium]
MANQNLYKLSRLKWIAQMTKGFGAKAVLDQERKREKSNSLPINPGNQ